MVTLLTPTSRRSSSDNLIELFTSDAPLGYAAGDANLTRYVTNSPTNSIDPDGLEGRILGKGGRVIIYINETNAPSSFNRVIVQQNLRMMFAPVNITLISTTSSAKNYKLGYTYDKDSFAELFEPNSSKPLYWFTAINPVYWFCRNGDQVGNLVWRRVKDYTGYVAFEDKTIYKKTAETPNFESVINLGTARAWTGNQPLTNVLWTNLIAHEQLYLGLQGESDDLFATGGTLSSGSGVNATKKLYTITKDDLQGVLDALDFEE